jgi:hypothetical protein
MVGVKVTMKLCEVEPKKWLCCFHSDECCMFNSFDQYIEDCWQDIDIAFFGGKGKVCTLFKTFKTLEHPAFFTAKNPKTLTLTDFLRAHLIACNNLGLFFGRSILNPKAQIYSMSTR